MDQNNNNKNNNTDETNSDTLSIRLTLAHGLVRMWQRAYDALLYHGVNVKSLPEFQDTTDLDNAMKTNIREGQAGIVRWLGRVESAIKAAVRRKGFRVW